MFPQNNKTSYPRRTKLKELPNKATLNLNTLEIKCNKCGYTEPLVKCLDSSQYFDQARIFRTYHICKTL